MNISEVESCGTVVARELDRQIIYKLNQSNFLVSFADFNIELGTAAWPYLQPAAKTALKKAIEDRGQKLVVNSGYRTIAQQYLLYQSYKSGRCGITAAARPPLSNHQSGLALDIEDYWDWKPSLEKFGWNWLGEFDRVHFDYQGGDTKNLSEANVKAFQELWNENNPSDLLDVDGDFGGETEKRLKNSTVTGFPKGEKIVEITATTLTATRNLRLVSPNMEGEDVRKVQEKLIAAGITVNADGFFGPNTDKAVKEFQQKKGLSADGIVGASTRQALGL